MVALARSASVSNDNTSFTSYNITSYNITRVNSNMGVTTIISNYTTDISISGVITNNNIININRVINNIYTIITVNSGFSTICTIIIIKVGVNNNYTTVITDMMASLKS